MRRQISALLTQIEKRGGKKVNQCCLSHLDACYSMSSTSFDPCPYIAAACTEVISLSPTSDAIWLHLLSFHCSSSCEGFEHTGRIEPIHLLISDPDCFSVLCPARFPRTVKPCEKIDSQLLITHLSLPAATSAEHWAQSDYRSSFTWISVAVITLLGKHREGQTSFVVCFLSPCSTVILVRIAAEAERKTV